MSEKPTYDELARKIVSLEKQIHDLTWIENRFVAEKQSVALSADKVTNLSSLNDIYLDRIINIDEIKSSLDDFSGITQIATAIVDLDGKVLVASGWQDICSMFHRANRESARNCTKSDLFLFEKLKEGEFKSYKCRNGLWDIVTPLFLGTRHVGNIYAGQFLYDDDEVDEEYFIQQAEKYDYDMESYIEAYRKIPRYSHKKVIHLMSFLIKVTSYISKIVLMNKDLAKEVKERKVAEVEASKAKEYLDSILNGIADPIFVKDEKHVWTTLNDAFCNLFNWSRDDLIGKSDYHVFPKEQADVFWAHDDKVMASNESDFNEEEILVKGKNRTISTIKSSFINPETGKRNIVGTIRDISKEIRLKEQLKEAQAMESLGRLAGGVAHDYNNALGAIIGFTELAIEDASNTASFDSAAINISLKEVLTAAEHAANITRQLLTFARKQPISPEKINLNESIEQTLKMLRRLIGENIELTFSPTGGLWDVKMDPLQVKQILANLSMNARDAIRGSGKITIETGMIVFTEDDCSALGDYAPGEFVTLSISDTGCGIHKDVQKDIFTPFFTTKDVDLGNGLGLPMVYGIVKQNNGFINVYSEPEIGTTIKIYLRKHSEESEVAKEGELCPLGNNKTILLVEDNIGILKFLQKVLSGYGYKVLAASSPLAAINIANAHSENIKLLVSDVIMPYMNGRELSDKLRISHPEIKIMFMSGYPADVIMKEGVLDKGVNFLQKPFAIKDLATSIQKALGS
jgi:PAS domain S-box-containing protein